MTKVVEIRAGTGHNRGMQHVDSIGRVFEETGEVRQAVPGEFVWSKRLRDVLQVVDSGGLVDIIVREVPSASVRELERIWSLGE